MQIVSQGQDRGALRVSELARPIPCPTLEFPLCVFERDQAAFPFRLKAASDKAVLRFDGPVAAFRALGIVACPLDSQPPLFKVLLVTGFDLFGSQERCFKACRPDRLQHRRGDSLIDLHGADGQAGFVSPFDQRPAPTMIAGRRGPAPVVGPQPAAALAAGGDALQQRSAFADSSTAAVWSRPRVAGNALEYRLVGLPVDVAGVMIVDQDVPLRSGQLAAAGPHRTGGIDMAFAPCLPVHVGTGIDRIGQHLVDRGVRRRDPGDVGSKVSANRKVQAFGHEPGPDAANRSELGKALEDGAYRRLYRLVGIDQDLGIGVASDESDRLSPVKFATGRLVADPAIEAGPQDVKLRLRECTFKSQQKPIVEQFGIVDAIGISDQRISVSAQVEQLVPVGVVPGEP